MSGAAEAVLTGRARWHVAQGDSLAWLRALPDASADAVVTDPPYSSGGAFRGDRVHATTRKYMTSTTRLRYPEFSGDNRDQRSFAHWCALWLAEALRVAKPGAVLVQFSDWRQVPSTTDAVQAGGWVWRGVAVWDKTEACRPALGRYAAQAEFVVWGSKGPFVPRPGLGKVPGVFREAVRPREKRHIAGKPTALMQALLAVCPEGGVVLDTFAGSATTGVAALRTGRRFLGCELDGACADLARERLAAEADASAPSAARAAGALA